VWGMLANHEQVDAKSGPELSAPSSAGDPADPHKSGHRRVRFSFGLDRFSGLYLWIAFLVIFGIWVPHLFLTQGTLHSVANEQAITALMALAVLVPLAAGTFDLSIGAVANFAAIVAVVLQDNLGWGVGPSIAVAIGSCVLIGAINGLIVVRLHVNSFIATLGMSSVIAAAQIIVSQNGQPNPPISTFWNSLTQHEVFGFQVVVFYLLAIALIVWWALSFTPVGRYIYAIGGNSEASRLSGVNVEKWTWLSLVTSATIAGIAGVLYGSLSGPSLTFGSGLLLPAFAAAFLGTTQLFPGRFNVWGTLIAVYVFATGIKGLQLVTSAQWLGDMFYGVALIIAVALAVWRQRRLGGTQRTVT
jgi:ribose transport system permease protein